MEKKTRVGRVGIVFCVFNPLHPACFSVGDLERENIFSTKSRSMISYNFFKCSVLRNLVLNLDLPY